MRLPSRVFETRASASSATSANSAAGCTLQTTRSGAVMQREACSRRRYLPAFSRNGLIKSIGMGKIVVEFFSVAISASVCR